MLHDGCKKEYDGNFVFWFSKVTWSVKCWVLLKVFQHFVSVLVSDPFDANGLFVQPLKTSKNVCFSVVFSGYRKRSLAWMSKQALIICLEARKSEKFPGKYMRSIPFCNCFCLNHATSIKMYFTTGILLRIKYFSEQLLLDGLLLFF